MTQELPVPHARRRPTQGGVVVVFLLAYSHDPPVVDERSDVLPATQAGASDAHGSPVLSCSTLTSSRSRPSYSPPSWRASHTAA